MELLSSQNKKLFKYFIVIFWLVALIINWNEISWVFNYRVISGFVSSLFQSEPEKNFAENETGSEIPSYLDTENSLEIPRIGISAPLIFPENSDSKVLGKLLDRGTVHFPGSALPGLTGRTIILGHSAPQGWPRIKYDWVFSRLDELSEGDEVFVYYNHQKYAYSVTKKIFLDRGEEISDEELTNSENLLVLISCWPPGQDLRRIAVEARLIK